MNVDKMTGSVLAFIGDAVMSLKVREYLVSLGYTKAKQLQEQSIKYVSAKAQSAFISKFLPNLSEEEMLIYKRGRNYKSHSTPKNTDSADYHAATGFEALWGYWHLSGEYQRIDQIFKLMTEEN